MKTKLLLFFLLLLVELAHAQIGSIIPSNRRVDWRNPGYEGNIPRHAKNFVNVKTQYIDGEGLNATDAFVTAIADANTWNSSHPSELSVLYFPEGNYALSSEINLQSNIIIKGDGSDKTVFSFADNGIKITGSSNSTYANIQSYTQATKTIVLTSSIGVQNGQLIEITVPNGWWHKPGEDGNEYVGQIVKVQNADGTTLVLEDDIYLVWLMEGASNKAKVRVFNPIQQVGIEDIKVVSSGLNNTHISINSAANCWISGVESQNPGLHHIGVGSGYRIEIRGCYFHEAKKVCVGGQGYGVHIGNHSTNCLVEDNIFRKLRHSMIAYGGATRNVFGFNYSGDRRADDPDGISGSCVEMNGVEADLLFHGRYPIANLAEGNVVDYIAGEVIHGINGQYNTVFRNKTVSNDVPISRSYGGIRFYEYSSGGCQLFNSYGNTLTDIDDQDYCCGVSDNYNGQNSMGDAVYSDISYFYESQPPFLAASGLSWPPVGTRTGPLLSQTNPAEQRWWYGPSKKTVSAGQIYTFGLTAQQFLSEGGNPSGGTYKINGTNVGATWSGVVANNQPVTIEAIPPDNNYSFFRWSDGSTDNPRVLTLTANTTLYANMKRHLYSTSSLGTANNSQRKIAQTIDGTYFMAYESQNRIWITKSADGVNWTNEFEVSAEAGYSIKKSPSIFANENGVQIVVVWHGTDGYNNRVFLREYNKWTNSWSPIHEFPWFESTSGFDATPVISRRDNYFDGTVHSTCVVWREPSGLAVVTKSDGDWSGVTYIPTTNGNCMFPSITRIGSDRYGICWLDGDADRIEYMQITHNYNSNAVQFPQDPTHISPDGWIMNQRPSIAVNGDWGLIITWQSFSNVAEGQSVHIREKSYNENYWSQTITSFSSSSASGAKPIAGTFLDLSSYYVLWEVEGSIYSTRGLGTTWTTPTIIASGSSGGTNISAINRSKTALREIWKKPNGEIAVNNSGLQKISTTEKFVSYRLNKHIITYLDSIPALREKGYKGMIAFEIAGLSQQSGSAQRTVETKNENDKNLRSEKISVASNADVIKLAGAYYAKGLKIPEKSALNEISHLIKVQLKDAATDEVVKEVWNVPFSRLAQATSTDGEFRTLNIPLSGLNGREVYLDVVTADTSQPIFVNDYYILSKEDERLKKFFEATHTLPTQYALHQNYPNPFNPSTTIRFDLIEPQYVTLKVYNSIGQEMKTIVNDYYAEGSHEVIFDASLLSSGAYFYRIVAGKFTATKSFLLVK